MAEVVVGLASVIDAVGVTCIADEEKLTCGGNEEGVEFAISAFAENRSDMPQIVDFIPADVVGGYGFTITINDIDYTYVPEGSPSVSSLVEALRLLVDANPDVSCAGDDVKVTCTAVVPGVVFTYNTSVFALNVLELTPEPGFEPAFPVLSPARRRVTGYMIPTFAINFPTPVDSEVISKNPVPSSAVVDILLEFIHILEQVRTFLVQQGHQG